MPSLLRSHIALPNDHGAWVFLLCPLLIGFFAGGQFSAGALPLILAAVAAFLLRQPLTVLAKVFSGRRGSKDRSAALLWAFIYLAIVVLSIAVLGDLGFGYVLILGLPGALVFFWYLYLISQRRERQRAGVDVVASGALALAAPAAFWVARGWPDPSGWWLWLLVWLQSAASIVYAFLRLKQRGWTETPTLNNRLLIGQRAILYATFNLVLVIVLAVFNRLPPFLFVPYLVQLAETLRGAIYPAIGWQPTRIGLRQTIISATFTLLFILTWTN